MSQIHIPGPRVRALAGHLAERPSRTALAARPFAWWVDAVVLLVIVTLAYAVVIAASRWVAPLTPHVRINLSPASLPLYAGLSTLRMALAYLLALAFSLIYARIATAHRAAERVMIPLLDILQSIPILSFLPGVVLALVALFPRSNVGLELAAILLIFTSQAWNMAFSFYHSLLVIPKDLREAASIYQLNAWRRFTRLELPYATIPLIWNSMMSWAGGWFFLMAAEQFTLGSHDFQLPGLGSYLQTAANDGDLGALALGLGTLIAVIVLLDQLLWRPLIAWADRFRLDQTASGQAPSSFVLRALRRSALVEWISVHLNAPAVEALDRGMSRLLTFPARTPVRMALGSTLPESLPESAVAGVSREQASPVSPTTGAEADNSRSRPPSASLPVALAPRQLLGWLVAALALGACVWGGIAAVRMLAQLDLDVWGTVTLATLATLARTTVALAIGVAWTVPVGVAIGMNPRLAERAQPIVQVVASIPATALFPALLLVVLRLPGGLELAAVGLMLLGTQWYILFNVIAGAMAIPSDLREAAAIYRLRGWRRWRYLILPAIFPALVTGMITATGGAWNASIVSEYVTFNNHIYGTVGLGALIASSANGANFALLLAATLAMAAVVVAVNRLVWRRLYGMAEQRFRLD